MSVLKLSVTTSRPDSYLESNFETATSKYSIVQRLINYLTAIQSGSEKSPSIAFSVQGNQVQASGTFTLDTVIATDAVSINGVTFTAVESDPGTNEFVVGADDSETAENLAVAINASATALVDNYVTASSTDEVVTVTSAFYGLAGNLTTIASADATITASGARLTGGAEDATAQTLSF